MMFAVSMTVVNASVETPSVVVLSLLPLPLRGLYLEREPCTCVVI